MRVYVHDSPSQARLWILWSFFSACSPGRRAAGPSGALRGTLRSTPTATRQQPLSGARSAESEYCVVCLPPVPLEVSVRGTGRSSRNPKHAVNSKHLRSRETYPERTTTHRNSGQARFCEQHRQGQQHLFERSCAGFPGPDSDTHGSQQREQQHRNRRQQTTPASTQVPHEHPLPGRVPSSRERERDRDKDKRRSRRDEKMSSSSSEHDEDQSFKEDVAAHFDNQQR